jgi:2,4-dienoyl-CoA reductase-like NADH-dependent reductase (Old Yellow Enzyme family)
MEEAIAAKSTDLVGIARPLCAEPYLCKELIVRSRP